MVCFLNRTQQQGVIEISKCSIQISDLGLIIYLVYNYLLRNLISLMSCSSASLHVPVFTCDFIRVIGQMVTFWLQLPALTFMTSTFQLEKRNIRRPRNSWQQSNTASLYTPAVPTTHLPAPSLTLI